MGMKPNLEGDGSNNKVNEGSKYLMYLKEIDGRQQKIKILEIVGKLMEFQKDISHKNE